MTDASPPPTPPPDDAAVEDDDEWEYVDEDDDDAPEGAAPPAAAAPVARSRVAELLALSAFCVMLGGMFAGAVLGVVYAPARRGVAPPSPAAALTAARADAGAATAHADDAACDADEAGAAQEADPELAGDGVMDDLDDGPAEPVPAATPTPAPAARPLLARTAPPAAAPAPPSAAPAPPRARRVVTSDDVPEGPAQGYVHGRPLRIAVTRLDNKPVEVHTAAAYRRMREAAQRDGVALRIASGFRTMEHQQALYRAYRQGRGNLAAVPGHSNHQSGHALDLNTSSPGVLRWLTRNGRRFGFRRTVPTEPWHWEWW